MVRKHVYIEEAQEAFLKRRAKELGVTEAELIRHAIERLHQTPVAAPFDGESWHDVLAFLAERSALGVSTTASTAWKREDAYEQWPHREGTLHRHVRSVI